MSFAVEPSINVGLDDVALGGVNLAKKTSDGRMRRKIVAAEGFHERYMPMEPLKYPIPRKTKEKRGWFYLFPMFQTNHLPFPFQRMPFMICLNCPEITTEVLSGTPKYPFSGLALIA